MGRPTKKVNRWGTHDEESFHPNREIPLRCYKCNRLMAADFSIEKKCPNCNHEFRKSEWRDMAIEAEQIHKIHGGWNRHILERLSNRDYPVTVESDGETPNEIDDVARNVHAWSTKAQRMTKWKRALKVKQKKMRKKLRNQSHVSRILGNNPYA